MKQNTQGDLATQCRPIDAVLVNGTTTSAEAKIVLEHMDGVSFQLISGGSRDVDVLTADAVVGATKTWTFKDGQFTAKDVGATIVVAGSASNNGSFVIASVTNYKTIVTGGVPVNETFVAANVTVTLTQVSPTGAWEISVSNTFNRGTATERANDGSPWTPITDQFFPVPAAVVDQYVKDTANSANQYVQAYPLPARAIKIKFTRATLAGPVSAYRFAKGNH